MKLLKSESLIIFFLALIPALLGALYISFELKLIFGDAIARSFHAYSVFFGNEPKLAAIGFVWPPLQTALQLPLVLIKPLNTHGFTGNVLSAIFFGLTLVYLNNIGKFFNVNKIVRYTLLTLFALNPYVFFYGINGMSEMVGIFFIFSGLYYFLNYSATKHIGYLIATGFLIACAVMTRWETGLLLLTISALIALFPFLKNKFSLREAESAISIFATPVVFALFVWLIVSWMIVGSPIYFLKSTYSFTEQDAINLANNSVIQEASGSIIGSLKFGFERIVPLSIIFLGLIGLVFLKLKKAADRVTALILLGFAFTIVFGQILPVFMGKSYGQLRYFIYAVPMSIVLLFFLFKNTVKNFDYKKMQLLIISAILIFASVFSSIYVMTQFGNREESNIAKFVMLEKVDTNEPYQSEEEIANWSRKNIHSRSVLIDDSMGFNIVYITGNSHLFIETVDSDFLDAVKDPLHSPAKYMMITDPIGTSGVDVVSRRYPKMFREGADFVTLEKDFGSWRLYKIKKSN